VSETGVGEPTPGLNEWTAGIQQIRNPDTTVWRRGCVFMLRVCVVNSV